jgi:hypothetical protein
MRSVNRRLGFGRTGPMILCSVLILLMPVTASALEWLDGKVQVHGFAGQGATYTDHNQIFGTSRDVSLDFREMGINTSVKLLPNLLISAQGLYRDAGASDRQGVRLDFAQADYSVPLLDSSLVLGVRGGRVKIPFGLYNDTRDVLWTRPSVLLPQSIYFDTLALRQAMIAADGGMLYGRYTYGEHRIGWEFMAADPQDGTGGATGFLTGIPNSPMFPKADGSLDGRPLLLGRVFYEWMGGRGKLMFSVVDLDRDFRSGSMFYQNGNTQVTYPLFSAQYNAESWSLTAEYGWIDSERSGYSTATTAFLPGLPTWKQNTSENFYLQGEYRFTADFSAVLRYDVLHLNRDDRGGNEMSRLSGGLAPSHRFYARDLTAGVRWSFARNFLLAADYHYVNGTAWLNESDNPNLTSPETSSHFSLVTAMLSFRF